MERLLLGTNKSKAMPTELNVTMSCLGHHSYMRLKPVPGAELTSGMEGVGRGILLNEENCQVSFHWGMPILEPCITISTIEDANFLLQLQLEDD